MDARDAGIEALLGKAADAIAASESLAAFTGAGISVESGIPPFRGAGGLWESYDPAVLDLGHFKRDPAESWKAIKALFYDHWGSCAPNGAHRVLAAWEGRGLLKHTITQNIDGLHQAAGSRSVSEYHGALRELVCLRCGERTPAAAERLERLPPRCSCGGVFKPDFVFFGEGIPREAAEASEAAALSCDCMLLVGTSGEVYPAAALPPLAKRRGAVLVEVNPAPSAYSAALGTLRVPLGAVEGMAELDRLVSARLAAAS